MLLALILCLRQTCYSRRHLASRTTHNSSRLSEPTPHAARKSCEGIARERRGNRRGTDYVIINRFEPPNKTENCIHQHFEKKLFNVLQKCFQYVEGVSSKYPKISRKNLAINRILSPKKAQRQNLWAPLEEKRFS